MPEKGIRSRYSQCPMQLLIGCNVLEDRWHATGSAFVYEHAGSEYLITNWHNVTGRHFLTGDRLSPDVGDPQWLEMKLMTSFGNGFTATARRVEILGESGEPLWFEHPEVGSECDVVALPFERPENCQPEMHVPANRINDVRVPVTPGSPVFVIGFPSSLSVGVGFPVWKSGYIASEPFYDVTINGVPSRSGGAEGGARLPAFFIDARTGKGMSGSPVFCLAQGSYDLNDPYSEVDPNSADFWEREDVALIIPNQQMEFIGCYSGRSGDQEQGADLGLCWRAEVIEEICKSGHPGSRPAS